MSKPTNATSPSRRRFVRMAGQAAAAAAGLGLLPLNKLLGPVAMSEAQAQTPPPDLYYAGTDGWIHLPDGPIFSNSLGVQTHPHDRIPALETMDTH